MLKPYPFQEEFIQRFLNHPKGQIGWLDPGLGKTLIAAEAGRRLEPGLFLVVGKKEPTVVAQWRNTVINQDPSNTNFEQWKEQSDLRNLAKSKFNTHYWIYVHYEFLIKYWTLFQTFRFNAVFVDEAHKVGNRNNKSTKALKNLRFVNHKMALTGTAMDKHAGELWSLLHWIDRVKFSSYWQFDEQFVDRITTFSGWDKIKGTKNLEELNKLIGPYVFKRTKLEAAPELPELIEQEIRIDLDPAHKRLYQKVKTAKDIVIELNDQVLLIENVLKKSIRLQQLASNPELLGLETALPVKLRFAKEYIEDSQNEQFIIFTTFIQTAIKAANLLGGVLADKSNPEQIKEFKDGKHQILVGTIDRLGEALDFKDVGTAIFLELDRKRSSRAMTQAINRIHRLSITRGKNILYLLAKGTIDELIYASIKNKWTDQEYVSKALKEGYI